MSVDIAKRRILNQVPLAALIGESVDLSNRSGRPTGLCPFHDEKTPSFTIFDNHYFCFGCRAHGDAIDYMRKTRGMGFMEALKYLADKYGIDVPELRENKRYEDDRQEAARIFRALQLSQDYFLSSISEHPNIFSYLRSRGFSEEMIKDVGFGYAPDRRQGLVNYLLQKGVSLKDAITASVATTSKKDKQTYDFFRHRLMIPIRDQHGRLVAFGGRAMGDDLAKYKNSRETPLFNKSDILFGLDKARDSIRKKKRAIVVEGYMDALQLWNHGFDEAVACLGTALTAGHMQRLGQMTEKVILFFDGDKAGERASLKAVSQAISAPQAEFKVARLPENHDPDSFLCEFDAQTLENDILAKSQDLLDFAITTKINGSHGLAIPDLIDRDVIPWLRSVQDPIKQSYLASKVSQLSGVSRQAMDKALQQRIPQDKEKSSSSLVNKGSKPESVEAKKKPFTRKLNPLEYDFLGHLYLAHPEELDLEEIKTNLALDLELEPLWTGLALELVKALKNGSIPASYEISYWLSSSELATIRLLESYQQKKTAFACENRRELMKKIVRTLRINQLSNTRQGLKSRLIDAEALQQSEILLAINKINFEIRKLEGQNVTQLK